MEEGRGIVGGHFENDFDEADLDLHLGQVAGGLHRHLEVSDGLIGEDGAVSD